MPSLKEYIPAHRPVEGDVRRELAGYEAGELLGQCVGSKLGCCPEARDKLNGEMIPRLPALSAPGPPRHKMGCMAEYPRRLLPPSLPLKFTTLPEIVLQMFHT
jgi:hypothetical protein